MPNHVVKQGECLWRIATQYGFRDYRTIYNDPKNAALRKKRPNPNLLFPGDVVFVPDKLSKREPSETTMLHRFELVGPSRVLRIVVEDLDGKKMTATPYEIQIEGKLETGVTGADGLIEKAIPMTAESGSLAIGPYIWPLSIAHLNPLDQVGDAGVSGVQARLRNMGYDPGPIDGIDGPRTKEAVRAFQEDNPPLKVDGICGPKTRAVLVQLYGC
jgi:N-acetylmuramoyl-L-alanine amidase